MANKKDDSNFDVVDYSKKIEKLRKINEANEEKAIEALDKQIKGEIGSFLP